MQQTITTITNITLPTLHYQHCTITSSSSYWRPGPCHPCFNPLIFFVDQTFLFWLCCTSIFPVHGSNNIKFLVKPFNNSFSGQVVFYRNITLNHSLFGWWLVTPLLSLNLSINIKKTTSLIVSQSSGPQVRTTPCVSPYSSSD